MKLGGRPEWVVHASLGHDAEVTHVGCPRPWYFMAGQRRSPWLGLSLPAHVHDSSGGRPVGLSTSCKFQDFVEVAPGWVVHVLSKAVRPGCLAPGLGL